MAELEVNTELSYCPYTGPNCTFNPGDVIRRCEAALNVSARVAFDPVISCVFNTLNEFDKALLNTRQVVFGLWPACVGLIAGFSHDPAAIVHDNVWWACLFAMTSSGLPGLNGSLPPHHLVVETLAQGHRECTAWQPSPYRPGVYARSLTVSRGRKAGYELVAFGFSCTLYLAFSILYGLTLMETYNFFIPTNAIVPGVWYWISAGPAILALFAEYIHDRVDLYEPAALEGESGGLQSPSRAQELTGHASKATDSPSSYPTGKVNLGPSGMLLRPRTGSEPAEAALDVSPGPDHPYSRRFQHVKIEGGFIAKWIRIIAHQWRRSEYRLLVRPPKRHWLFDVWDVIIGLGRITVFAWGSVVMGNIVLMPYPNDSALFVLLLVTTAIPRFSWPGAWTSGPRGADLVVFVKPMGSMRQG